MENTNQAWQSRGYVPWASALASMVWMAAGLPAQQPPASGAALSLVGAPAVETMVERAMARAKWVKESKLEQQYTHIENTILEELDSKERVKRRTEQWSRISYVEGQRYDEPVFRDDASLPEPLRRRLPERTEESRQRAAEWARQQAQRRKQRPRKEEYEVKFDQELVSRYRYALVGRELVNGRPAYVLVFEPKSADLPVRRKLDYLLNKLAGRAWIDEQDYEIARLELRLAEPVSVWGGLLASVRELYLWAEQSKVDNVAWFPTYADGHLQARVMLRTMHVKVKQSSSDFHRMHASRSRGNPGKP